jgi:two-component sensor histidine kinase
MLEVFPQTEHSWLDKFEEVYTTGIPTRFEEYSKVFETYIEVNIYAPQKGQLTVISSDITERKRVEVALQKSLTILNETGKIAKVGGWELDLATGIPTWTDETLLIFEIDRSKNPLLMLDGLNFYTPVSRQILEHALWRTIEYGEPYDLDLQAITTKGKHIWVHTIGKAERENGKTIRVSGFIHDITERKQAEDRIKALLGEKELLLKETHHRIKNNMSTLISLMSLQKKTIKEPAAVEALNDAGNRVRSMMVLYDKLYRSSVQEAISIKEYLPALIDEIISNFPCGIPLKIEKRVDAFVIDVKQLQPLGIIINELLTNMIKYAFTDRDSGLIIVSASLRDNIVSITIQDNGNCIPQSIDFENSPGFGLRLVGILTKQLEGTIRIERKNGTTIMLDFEKQK